MTTTPPSPPSPEATATRRAYDLYITPEDDAEAVLLARAQACVTSLHVLIYGFTIAALGDILTAKHAAGLSVGVVSDRTQAGGPKQKVLLQRIADAGVPVIITESRYDLINHEKALICDVQTGFISDDSRVCFGSFNFSDSAQKQNNHLIDTNDAGMTQRFWLKYQAAATFGLTHPDWQITPHAAKAVALTIPPPQGLTTPPLLPPLVPAP